MKNGTIKIFVGWSDHGFGTENARADYWASHDRSLLSERSGRSTVTTTDAASVYKYKHSTIEGIVDVYGPIVLIIYTNLM